MKSGPSCPWRSAVTVGGVLVSATSAVATPQPSAASVPPQPATTRSEAAPLTSELSLPYRAIPLPAGANPTLVTGEGAKDVWLVGEREPIFHYNGKRVRQVVGASWGLEQMPGSSFSESFDVQDVAARGGNLYLAGLWSTWFGRRSTSFVRVEPNGRVKLWHSGMDPTLRFFGPVELGAIAPYGGYISWLSGATSYVGVTWATPHLVDPSRFWLADQGTVCFFDGWSRHSLTSEFDSFVALRHDGASNLWAIAIRANCKAPYANRSSCYAVARESRGQWTGVPTPPGFDANQLDFQRPDKLWFFGQKGLFRYDNRGFSSIRSPVAQVTDLWFSPEGTLFLVGLPEGTNQTGTRLFSVELASLENAK